MVGNRKSAPKTQGMSSHTPSRWVSLIGPNSQNKDVLLYLYHPIPEYGVLDPDVGRPRIQAEVRPAAYR